MSRTRTSKRLRCIQFTINISVFHIIILHQILLNGINVLSVTALESNINVNTIKNLYQPNIDKSQIKTTTNVPITFDTITTISTDDTKTSPTTPPPLVTITTKKSTSTIDEINNFHEINAPTPAALTGENTTTTEVVGDNEAVHLFGTPAALKSAYSQSRCSMSEFVCSNGKCVTANKFCDKVNDCGDNSDEPRFCSRKCILHILHGSFI